MKTMRPRSSSVRSQRLFKASSAYSGHASVQGGSRDRRSRVWSVRRARLPFGLVCCDGRWPVALPTKRVCGPWHCTGAEGGGAEGSSPFGRSGLSLPQSFPTRAWCSTGVHVHRERVAQFGLGSPTSPACAVKASWRLLPPSAFPSEGCSSRTAGHRRAASASSSSRRPCRSWRRRALQPGPCPVVASSSP